MKSTKARLERAAATAARCRTGSQSSRRKRVRHQLADAVPVERNDEKQIELAGQVVDRADGGDDDARSVTVAHFQHRQPEIQVLVVTPGDDFIIAERENRPDADLFADGIAILDPDMEEDFGRGRRTCGTE